MITTIMISLDKSVVNVETYDTNTVDLSIKNFNIYIFLDNSIEVNKND